LPGAGWANYVVLNAHASLGWRNVEMSVGAQI
jgi:hypothetical protein